MLPRLQLIELEDLAWFPPTIRDLATDYLRFMEARFALHRPVVPLLRAMIERCKTERLVDLCSGGGGPVLALSTDLAAGSIYVQFTLTDKYPNIPAFERLSVESPSRIYFVAEAIEATCVPDELVGIRTMFNAFHHFAPVAARQVLANAVQAGQPIAIFEIPDRRFLMMLPFLFTPVFVALATPFIRPFRWNRLLWTYLIPLVPLTCWWDGLVSACRAYTVDELMALTKDFDEYQWESGRVGIHGMVGRLTYLLGIPDVLRAEQGGVAELR